MVKEKSISSPVEEVSGADLVTQGLVSKEDEAKQKSYDKRHKKFMEEFNKLQDKYDIKLLLTPAKILYYDKKDYKETK